MAAVHKVPSVPSIVCDTPPSNGTPRRASPNILHPTKSSPLPFCSSSRRRLSVPIPQDGLFSPSPDLSSDASSSPRRPSYVSCHLAASGRIKFYSYG